MIGSKTTRLAAALGLAFAGGAFAAPAVAQEGVLMRNLLGAIGLIDQERPEIVYRERPPLVVPPKMELPPPQQAGSAAQRNPQWPSDPDLASARASAERESIPYNERRESRELDRDARLPIDQIRAGRRAGAGVGQYAAPAATARDEHLLTPTQLRALAVQNENRRGPASALERQALTDPPSAFLAPAPGAPVRATSDPIQSRDVPDPGQFIRDQARRR